MEFSSRTGMVRKVSLAREPMCRGTIKQITDALALTRRNSMYDEITVGLCVTLETQTRALVSSPKSHQKYPSSFPLRSHTRIRKAVARLAASQGVTGAEQNCSPTPKVSGVQIPWKVKGARTGRCTVHSGGDSPTRLASSITCTRRNGCITMIVIR